MKLKRLMMLALCLALVCGLSVTAFAFSEPFDNGNTIVDWSASIHAYYTIGVIEVETYIFDANPDTEASVDCSYLDNNYIRCYGHDDASNEFTSLAFVGFPDGAIYHMIDATFNFWAEVPTSYGWQQLKPDEIYLEYDVT